MRCLVCEAENLDDAAECASCGKVLRVAGADLLAGEAPRMDGLESTQLSDVDLAVPSELLPGIERTQVLDSGAPSQWTGGDLALERTMLEVDPSAVSSWTGVVELDRGREEDAGPRTPVAAESANCPWCGVPSLGAVCDSCGRRKSRYTRPPASADARSAVGGETVSCPSCFARVPQGERCSDCGLPFPLQEL
jgi:hypothetical protein